MRPSISVTLEPGLERGVPWGRDLYTFVTSAAGHMMRTLQKPRKNRPSKRQVNHRRFLHNMIQRKFADIEAANHRLATALYFKEEEKTLSSLPPQKPETLDQSGSSPQSDYQQDPQKCTVHTGAGGIPFSGRDISIGLKETEISEKKQPDLEHLRKRNPKSQPSTCILTKNSQSKGDQKKETTNQELVELTSTASSVDSHYGAEFFHIEYDNDESQPKSTNNLSEDSQTTQQDSGFSQFSQNVDISPVFSPGFSMLSLDSFDSANQIFTDLSTCTQAQKNIADISESQWTDILDLFSGKDFAGCMDVESYFESICGCQGDAEWEVRTDDVGFADQSGSLTERMCRNRSEDLHCEADKYRYEHGYSCPGDQELTVNPFQSALRQTEDAAKTHFDHFKPFQSTDIIQTQLCTSVSYNYDMSALQMYQHPQEESPCMLLKNQNLTPFEGVAESFSVPPPNPQDRPIQTPPNADDWLFTDILQDRTSPVC